LFRQAGQEVARPNILEGSPRRSRDLRPSARIMDSWSASKLASVFRAGRPAAPRAARTTWNRACRARFHPL